VFAAIALLALSLSFSAYAEISFALASVSAGAAPGFAIGRLLWPLLWFAVQAWVLFKLVQGRNWARILIIVFVALAVALRYVAINSPLAQLSDASTLAAAVAQTMVELVAVLLLIMAGNYFAPRASA
jgi:flagellar biogenesis protein FliO